MLDQRRVVSASRDGTLRVWDVETGEQLCALEGHTSGVETVAVLDHRSVTYDGTLRFWGVGVREQLCALDCIAMYSVMMVVDQRRVVSASDDRTLRVWDVETGKQLRALEGHTDSVRAVAVVDQRRVVSASDDRTLRVWDVDTARTGAVFTLDAPARTVAFVRDRRLLVAGDESGRVHFLDLIELDVAPQASRRAPSDRLDTTEAVTNR